MVAEEEMKVKAKEAAGLEPEGPQEEGTEEEVEFGVSNPFPTTRWPAEFQRHFSPVTSPKAQAWFQGSGLILGDRLTPAQKEVAVALMY